MPQPDQTSRGRPRDRIAAKLSRFVFVSFFASAFVVSWISLQTTHASLRRSIDRSYPRAVELAAERQRGWLYGGLDEIAAVAAAGPIALPGSSPRGARQRPVAALTDALEEARRASTRFAGLAALGPDGSVVASAGSLPERLGCAPAGAPAPPTGPELEASLQTGARGGEALAVTPLPGGGCLVGVFGRSPFAALLARDRPGPEAQLILVNAAGYPVARSPGPDRQEPPPETPLELPAAGGVAEYTNAAGEHVIGSVAPLGELGWSVSLESPFDSAFEPVLSSAALILAVDLCVILVFSYLAYRRAAALVKPIETLCEGAQRISAGQFDVEIPPVDTRDEIAVLTGAFNAMTLKLRRDQLQIEATHRSLVDRNQDLRQANEILSQLSITDGLTKLHNHRFFQDHLTREIKRVNRLDEKLSMLLVDIDDFKALNDRYGHSAGDEVLVGIARIMDSTVRESDLLARYGGEEFVVLAPDTDREGAFYLAEKIRTAIAESSFILGESLRPTRLTVSIGVAQYEGNRKKFFVNADRALYSAKAQGKNCVVMHDDD